jgi:hypothetical protein
MKRLLAFLRHSFSDARGVPDGKLLTLAAVATVAVLTYPVGWCCQVWPPEYIYSPTLLFLAAGLGIDAYVTRAQIRADSALAQATATGQPVPEYPAPGPPPAPAPAVDLTLTTVVAEAVPYAPPPCPPA